MKNDVNAVIESSVYPQFCFSQSNILTATICIAHCVSCDFAMGKGLASALVCGYPELQQTRKMSLNLFPSGSLFTYFDQQHQRFIWNLVTKDGFLINLPMEHLNWAFKRWSNTWSVIIFKNLPSLNLDVSMTNYIGQQFFRYYSKFFRVQTLLWQYFNQYDNLACHYSTRQLFWPATLGLTIQNLGWIGWKAKRTRIRALPGKFQGQKVTMTQFWDATPSFHKLYLLAWSIVLLETRNFFSTPKGGVSWL